MIGYKLETMKKVNLVKIELAKTFEIMDSEVA